MERQVHKLARAAHDLPIYLGEYIALVFIAALECGWICETQCAVIGLPGQIGQTSPAA
jgi:hypothetical protein